MLEKDKLTNNPVPHFHLVITRYIAVNGYRKGAEVRRVEFQDLLNYLSSNFSSARITESQLHQLYLTHVLSIETADNCIITIILE